MIAIVFAKPIVTGRYAGVTQGELGPGARDGGAGGAAPAQDAVEELSRLSGMDLRVTEEQQRAREQVRL